MNQNEIDAQDLAEMDAVCFGKEAMSVDDWLAILDDHSMVAREHQDGKLAGIAVAKWDAGIGYFYSMAVYPDFRKQGIGTKLVTQRLTHLADLCHRIQAHTRIGNVASQAALRKGGFEAIQYVTDFYDDFEDAILWEKRL